MTKRNGFSVPVARVNRRFQILRPLNRGAYAVRATLPHALEGTRRGMGGANASAEILVSLCLRVNRPARLTRICQVPHEASADLLVRAEVFAKSAVDQRRYKKTDDLISINNDSLSRIYSGTVEDVR